MIQLDGLSHTYPGASRPALRDINVNVPAGSFRWLIGSPGSGKTTLLRLLALSLKPVAGRLDLFGVPVRRAPRSALARLRRRTGAIFQEPRLLADQSIFDNVALPLRLDRVPEAQAVRKVTEMLDWMGLGRRSGFFPSELSSSERRRVAVARAVVHRPRLLLADEPFATVDATWEASILELLADLHRLGSTVIVASSDEALIDRLPHAMLRLECGHLSSA